MPIKEAEHELFERTKRYLQAELKRAGVTHEELARRLEAIGWHETKGSIAAKISRGGFPAAFFVAALKAIGRENVNLTDL
jgi:hypothetical protein